MLLTMYAEPIVGLLFLSVGLLGIYKLSELYRTKYDLYPWFDDHKLKLIALSAPFGLAVLIQYAVGMFIGESIFRAAFSIILPVVLILVTTVLLKELKEKIVKRQFKKNDEEMPTESNVAEAEKTSFENPAHGTEENPNIDMAEESDSDIHSVAERFKDTDNKNNNEN